jgi:hypothetical protein
MNRTEHSIFDFNLKSGHQQSTYDIQGSFVDIFLTWLTERNHASNHCFVRVQFQKRRTS